MQGVPVGFPLLGASKLSVLLTECVSNCLSGKWPFSGIVLCKGVPKPKSYITHRMRANLNQYPLTQKLAATPESAGRIGPSTGSILFSQARQTYGYKTGHHGGMVFGRASFHPGGIWRWREPLAYRITSRRSASSSQDLHWSSHSMLLKSSIKEPHALIGSYMLQLIIDKLNTKLGLCPTHPHSPNLGSFNLMVYIYIPKTDKQKYC